MLLVLKTELFSRPFPSGRTFFLTHLFGQKPFLRHLDQSSPHPFEYGIPRSRERQPIQDDPGQSSSGRIESFSETDAAQQHGTVIRQKPSGDFSLGLFSCRCDSPGASDGPSQNVRRKIHPRQGCAQHQNAPQAPLEHIRARSDKGIPQTLLRSWPASPRCIFAAASQAQASRSAGSGSAAGDLPGRGIGGT